METLASSETISVTSPVSLRQLYSFEADGRDRIDKIFQQARNIQPSIEALTAKERIEYVMKIKDYVIANRESLIDRIVAETGKSRFDAFTSEIFEICDVIEIFKKKALGLLKDQKVPTPLVLMGKKSYVIPQPLGVILVITPWNYPLYQTMIPSIFAFLAGNAVVVKPSEVTPLRGVVEEILEKSGFLKDAIQIVYGGKETGSMLIDSRPDKIHFTGSCATGRKIMEHASRYLIPVDLELGGKDASIVFDDVDIDRTANGILWGAFTTTGQSCTSIERLYVHQSIYDKLLNEIVRLTQQLKTVSSEDDLQKTNVDVGAVTASFQLRIIEEHVRDAIEKGAEILCGGKRIEGTQTFMPTVLVNVNHSMKIMTEETFGPVLPIMPFQTEEEVIHWANDSPYGLGGSVWSKDLKRADRVARAMKTGNVSINSHMITEANPHLPFGGVKESGFGRYKGDFGIWTFCNMKSVLVDKQSSMIEAHWYPFSPTKYKLLNTILDSLFVRSKKWLNVLQTAMQLDKIGRKEKY